MNEGSGNPPVIDYEGSDYQTSFWEEGGREYEDLCERTALRRLLPDQGQLLLEIGAGAGRNTPRYRGFQQIVLLDYSLTQLQQAQAALGKNDAYIYVAGDVYHLPFVDQLFDGSTMIRVLHHMQDPLAALRQAQRVLKSGAPFILEYANKHNLKAILRYWLGRQDWDPFSLEAVEFTELNYDFHPRSVRRWLDEAGFDLKDQRTVSHFRVGFLKRTIPAGLLASLDALFQPTGKWWQLSPSVFTRSIARKAQSSGSGEGFFRCPDCGTGLSEKPGAEQLACPDCGKTYPIVDGIYDFRG
ncbi:MAG: methyltransferase domain-containing protein, partial [Anaerolineales bacterium]